MAQIDAAPTVKVLIIEGHPAVRAALSQRLNATPQLEVLTATSSVAAALSWLELQNLSALPSESPDVIILGLQSADDDDLLFTVQEIRELLQYQAAVITLAPYADETERMLLQAAGIKQYLLKHINSNQLIQEIQKAAFEDAG
ncbi:MAG: response regulator [Chloroflexota bacterium]